MQYAKPVGLFIACAAPVFAAEVAVVYYLMRKDTSDQGPHWKEIHRIQAMRRVAAATLMCAPPYFLAEYARSRAADYLGVS